MRGKLTAALLILGTPASANTFPQPSADSPRIQTAEWQLGQPTVLTAIPDTPLTVMLEPGEEIMRVTLSADRDWAVKVSTSLDSFTVLPELGARPASLAVETLEKSYDFTMQIGNEPMAAYLVRFVRSRETPSPGSETWVEPGEARFQYRLRGDKVLRPSEIFDDGNKTWIGFEEAQALPAIFAIGPTGEEQIVNGYVRGSYFVIDRVYNELVFRIDKDKATARRQVSGRDRR